MSAVDSSSTRKPIDTISSVPGRAAGSTVFGTSRWWGTILPSSPLSRPSTPSMRGTLKPQMSASSTPTRRPRAASAAARFTVTELLPTPPLPLDTASTRVVTGMVVSGAFSARVEAGPLHRGRLLLLGHLDPAHLHVGDAGEPVELRLDLAPDLGLERAAEGGERDVHRDDAVGGDGHVVHHPEVDDARLELGVHDPAEHPADGVDASAAGAGARRSVAGRSWRDPLDSRDRVVGRDAE